LITCKSGITKEKGRRSANNEVFETMEGGTVQDIDEYLGVVLRKCKGVNFMEE